MHEMGHKNKMATMPIYMVKTLKKTLLRTERTKLGMQYWRLWPYQVYPYDDPWLTLTYLKSRSNQVT